MGDNADENPAVILQPAGGGEIVRSAEDAKSAETIGEQVVSPEVHAAEGRREARRNMFDNFGDKALTFAEGLVDAASAGFLHLHGEDADIRRDVNSGAALVGQLAGTAIGLEGGPVKWLAGGGKAFGKSVARTVIGDIGAASRGVGTATRAFEAAGEGAALMAGTAFGHEVSDAIIEDKPFSSEVILHEAGLGALLGGGFGLLSGAFSKVASRGAVEAQGGLAAGEGVTTHVRDAIDSLNKAFDTHAQRAGVLDVLADEGHISDDFMAPRRDAVKAAQGVRDRIAGIDVDAALKGDADEYLKLRNALDDYQLKMQDLDEAMRPRMLETAKRVQLGRPEDVAGYGQEPIMAEDLVPEGHVMEGNMKLVAAMEKDPAAAARYKEIHGRDFWEGSDAIPPETPTEPMTAQGPSEGAATPMERTNAGSAKARRAVPEVGTPEPNLGTEPAGGQSPETQARLAGRRISPSQEAIERNNVLSNQHADLAQSQVLLPDGFFMPAKDADNVANAFSRFQDKMADDTLLRKARKAESMKQYAQEPHVPVVPEPKPMASPEPGGVPLKRGRDTVVDEVPNGRLQGALDKDAARSARQSERAATEASGPPEGMQSDRTTPSGAPKGMPAPRAQNVRDYINKWQFESQRLGPRVSPGDQAAARISEVMNNLRDVSQGRFESASTLELAEKLGVSGARTPLGELLDQAWTVRQAGRLAADESHGLKTPLRASARSHVMDWMKRRAGGKLGAAVAGAVVGNEIGGPAGYFMGAALASKYMGFGGRAAAAAGRAYQKVVSTADSLLRGSRATIAARAVAGNRPYTYSERGPIREPVERIQEIQRLAGAPEEIRRQVQKSLGDLVVMHPAIAQMLEDRAVEQVKGLSIKAPAIYFNALGKAIPPPAGAMRQFHEYENATHSFDGVLNSIASGGVTRNQAAALREQWPEVHGKLAQELLADPERLQRMNLEKLRTIELITGYPLTPGSDPQYIARQQAAWLSATQTGAPPQAPQSFKISAPPQTPAQAGARAPGN